MTLYYPSNDVTPHGQHMIFKGDVPDVDLHAYDDSIVFYLMGGRSISDRVKTPERVEITGLQGLMPPWQIIDQKGATQDGVDYIDTLYDPCEAVLDVVCRGRNPTYTRQVIRDLYASLDPKSTSELSWSTHEMGRWWAKVRWLRAPVETVSPLHTDRQNVSLRLRVDDAFWRSYDSTSVFGFDYADPGQGGMIDTFETDYSGDQNLGPNWPQYYAGAGAGYCSTTASSDHFLHEQARWYTSGTQQRQVVNGPYRNFETATDNQVIAMVLGTIPHWSLFSGAYNDIWGRMSRDAAGNWTGNGIRLRIGMQGILGWIRLSRFNNFVETVLRERILFVPPLIGEKFSLVCGFEDNPRRFAVQRNGLQIMNMVENGTGSLLGPQYRGVGFGMYAGATTVIPITQIQPAFIRKVSAGNNGTISQSGFLQLDNIGDQPMWPRYTCYGPGTFNIADGPGGEPIKFGPLLPNQVVQLRTDPRKRAIVDLTSVPPTPQQLTQWQQAIKDFLDFATGGNVPPLVAQIESVFGIMPPQGNLYTLLNGRFNTPLPPKSPGNPAVPHSIAVSIDDGNAMSQIIAAGTPLRRYPL